MNKVSWQRNLRRLGGSVAALMLACPIAGAQGFAGAPAAVWAIGLADGYIIMEHQESVIHVTATDVARGAVEVRGGSRFVVTSGSPARYTVNLQEGSAQFRSVQVEGRDRVIALDQDEALAAHQGSAPWRRVISLDYRFTLAPETAPGTYAWPVELVANGDRPAMPANSRLPPH